MELVNRQAIDVPMILHRLLCDPRVEYVMLSWDETYRNASSTAGKLPLHGRHADEQSLHRVRYWSDRPHFARRASYLRRVWPHFSPLTRALTETQLGINLQVCQHKASHACAAWGMWMYAPTRCKIDGECVDRPARAGQPNAGSCRPQHERHHICGRYLTSSFKPFG